MLAIPFGIASLVALLPLSSFAQEADRPLETGRAEASKKESRQSANPSLPDAPPPRRIISLAPSITELLFSLGVASSVSAGPAKDQQLVAVSQFCDYPAEIENLPRVGSLTNPQFETIVQLQPDLLLGVSDGGSIAQRAEALGIATQFTPQRNLKELFQSIATVARLVNRQEQGEALAERLRTALREAKLPKAVGKKALLVFWESLREASVYAAGSNSLDEDMLLAIGLENALKSSQSYVQLSLEGILLLKPDIIIILAPGIEREKVEQRVREFSISLQSLAAIRNNTVLLLNGEQYLRPGPRTIEAITDLRNGIQPLLEQ